MAAILIVDDEIPIRQALRRCLEVMHHFVLEARDGVEALEILSGHEVELAIVDLMMPRMDGLELLSHMRDEYSRIKVIVISGFDELTDLAEREGGVVTTLRKPFEPTDVTDALQLALGEL